MEYKHNPIVGDLSNYEHKDYMDTIAYGSDYYAYNGHKASDKEASFSMAAAGAAAGGALYLGSGGTLAGASSLAASSFSTLASVGAGVGSSLGVSSMLGLGLATGGAVLAAFATYKIAQKIFEKKDNHRAYKPQRFNQHKEQPSYSHNPGNKSNLALGALKLVAKGANALARTTIKAYKNSDYSKDKIIAKNENRNNIQKLKDEFAKGNDVSKGVIKALNVKSMSRADSKELKSLYVDQKLKTVAKGNSGKIDLNKVGELVQSDVKNFNLSKNQHTMLHSHVNKRVNQLKSQNKITLDNEISKYVIKADSNLKQKVNAKATKEAQALKEGIQNKGKQQAIKEKEPSSLKREKRDINSQQTNKAVAQTQEQQTRQASVDRERGGR
jgi:cytidylate kinase